MHTPQHALRGIGLMLCAVFIFAMMDCTSKWLVTKYSLPLLVWARYVVHCLLMLVFLLPSHGRRLWYTKRPGLQIVRALMLFFVTGLMMASFRLVPLTVATAILFITPLLLGLLSGPVLGEKVFAAQGAAIFLGLVGMLLIARPGGEVAFTGVLFAAIAALCNTGYQLLTRKLAANESSVSLLFYTALTGSVCATALLPWFWNDIIAAPPIGRMDAFLMGMLGVMGGGSHYLLIRAFRHAPAATLAPFVYVQLICAGLLDLLIFDRLPDSPTWLGVSLIAGAGLSMVLREYLSARSRPGPPADIKC